MNETKVILTKWGLNKNCLHLKFPRLTGTIRFNKLIIQTIIRLYNVHGWMNLLHLLLLLWLLLGNLSYLHFVKVHQLQVWFK